MSVADVGDLGAFAVALVTAAVLPPSSLPSLLLLVSLPSSYLPITQRADPASRFRAGPAPGRLRIQRRR